jgi:hypothetical protein
VPRYGLPPFIPFVLWPFARAFAEEVNCNFIFRKSGSFLVDNAIRPSEG